MLLLADKAQIFLDYLINTRHMVSAGGGYKGICRHSSGYLLPIERIDVTQEAALHRCQMAALIDFMRRSPSAQFLARLGDGGAVVMASNEKADKLFGGKMAGTSCDWVIPDVCRKCPVGMCKGTRRTISQDGRLLELEVTERVVIISKCRLIIVECR